MTQDTPIAKQVTASMGTILVEEEEEHEEISTLSQTNDSLDMSINSRKSFMDPSMPTHGTRKRIKYAADMSIEASLSDISIRSEPAFSPDNSGLAGMGEEISAMTRRRCQAAQLYFFDYYVDLLNYLSKRRQRLSKFREDTKSRGVEGAAFTAEWQLYLGKERSLLRKRRVRTAANQFTVLAQIGQGGYGQVFLARKKDTREVCALKKMSKRLLTKLNEVITFTFQHREKEAGNDREDHGARSHPCSLHFT